MVWVCVYRSDIGEIAFSLISSLFTWIIRSHICSVSVWSILRRFDGLATYFGLTWQVGERCPVIGNTWREVTIEFRCNMSTPISQPWFQSISEPETCWYVSSGTISTMFYHDWIKHSHVFVCVCWSGMLLWFILLLHVLLLAQRWATRSVLHSTAINVVVECLTYHLSVPKILLMTPQGSSTGCVCVHLLMRPDVHQPNPAVSVSSAKVQPIPL